MKRSKICGLYTITNLVNGKMYVGKSVDVYDRLSHHKAQLKGNRHINPHLQHAFNKYGEDLFSFEILEEWDRDVVYSMENYWVNMLNTTHEDFGYNLKGTSPTGHTLHTKEIRRKISQNRVNKTVSLEVRARISKTLTGRKNPDKGKKVICTNTGKIFDSIRDLAEFLCTDYDRLTYRLNASIDIGYKFLNSTEELKTFKKTKKKVEHIPTGQVFESIAEACIAFDLPKTVLYLRIRRNYSNNEFRYLERENLPQKKAQLVRVQHIESGMIFDTMRQAEIHFGYKHHYLSKHMKCKEENKKFKILENAI